MKLCISEATIMPGSFADDVEALAAGGVTGMEVWLTKLETHLEKHSVDETRSLLRDNHITLAAGAYQGGLLVATPEARKAHLDHFRRRLDLCQHLGIPTVLLLADYVRSADEQTLQTAVENLREATQWASAFNVRLALEFRSSQAFCTSLDTACALVAQCGEPNVGVCFDVFHYYTGPSKFEDLAFLTRENLAHVQLCDVAGLPRELATDADRVLPGDGDFQLVPIVEHFQRIGYDGWVSLESMNPALWQAKPAHVAEIGMAALKRVLEGASAVIEESGASS